MYVVPHHGLALVACGILSPQLISNTVRHARHIHTTYWYTQAPGWADVTHLLTLRCSLTGAPVYLLLLLKVYSQKPSHRHD